LDVLKPKWSEITKVEEEPVIKIESVTFTQRPSDDDVGIGEWITFNGNTHTFTGNLVFTSTPNRNGDFFHQNWMGDTGSAVLWASGETDATSMGVTLT